MTPPGKAKPTRHRLTYAARMRRASDRTRPDLRIAPKGPDRMARDFFSLRARTAAMLGVPIVACVLFGASAAFGTSAQTTSRVTRHVVYCEPHNKPRDCIAVPKAAHRPPPSVNEQGGRALTPPDVVNGGGLGGGPDEGRATALAWAKTQLGNAVWAYRCERFVEEAYGTRFQFATAWLAATHLGLHREPPTMAPAGALLYFGPDPFNHGYGHVGISLGNGTMISALDTVQVTDLAHSPYWSQLYRGWASAPASWPGRLPPPPGPTEPLVSSQIQITAPAFGSIVGGTVPLAASAANVGGVTFEAYYASDPANSQTASWHDLGNATLDAGTWTLPWNTAEIPDQGNASWGTINIAAIALDANGNRTGTRDYRRISVNNSNSTVPPMTSGQSTTTPATTTPTTPTTTPTTPTTTTPPTSTPTQPSPYPETVGGDTHTWTDYANAGGTEGPLITSNATVQVACKVSGFRVADGDTWWYRIASSPWSNSYYASSDAFYNNGQTSGSLNGTPFYDPDVPNC
jgi:NlpC/P60 family protein